MSNRNIDQESAERLEKFRDAKKKRRKYSSKKTPERKTFPRKKRVSRKAKKGFYKSTKTGVSNKYRSSWEMIVMQHLDGDNSVLRYDYEPFQIEYFLSKSKTAIRHHYTPDFLVEYNDGSKVLIEVKPKNKLTQKKNIRKFEAATRFCAENNMKYEIWTDDKIKQLKKDLDSAEDDYDDDDDDSVVSKNSPKKRKPKDIIEPDNFSSLSTLYSSGYSVLEIARKFEMDPEMVSVILRNNKESEGE